MNKIKKLSAGLLASAIIGIALTGPSSAATTGGSAQSATQSSAAFACTGIGLEQRDNPRWNAYPAKIEVDEVGGPYLGQAKLTVDNAAGKTIYSSTCDAPWLVMKLAPGQYNVRAQVGSYQEGANFTVPAKGQTAVILTFPKSVG
jgi:hypothetical protein